MRGVAALIRFRSKNVRGVAALIRFRSKKREGCSGPNKI